MPKHVAIIMDGNRRWAAKRGIAKLDGHRAAVNNMLSILDYLSGYGIKYATLYLFSTENWNRSKDEIDGLFQLFEEMLEKKTPELNRRGVRIRHLGHLEGLPESLQKALTKALEATKNNTDMILCVSVNYGGRTEILDAVQRIIREGIPPEKINEELFGNYLDTAGLPDVDLLIRTSGELRTSNFLPWQTVYSELYFTDVLWPDFGTKELEQALQSYSQRQRRFGGG